MFLSSFRVFPIDIRGRMGPEHDDARFEPKLGYRSISWIVRQPRRSRDDQNCVLLPALVSGGVGKYKVLKTRWISPQDS